LTHSLLVHKSNTKVSRGLLPRVQHDHRSFISCGSLHRGERLVVWVALARKFSFGDCSIGTRGFLLGLVGRHSEGGVPFF
jgi:hypothetical protein